MTARFRIVPTGYRHQPFRVERRKLFRWENVDVFETIKECEACIKGNAQPALYNGSGDLVRAYPVALLAQANAESTEEAA